MRTGSPSSSTQRASSPRGSRSWTAENSTVASRGARASAGRPLGPLVVGAVGDDELQLVPRPQRVQVLPAVAIALAAPRALEVDDAAHAFGNRVDREAAAGLEQHLVSAGEQRAHQIDRFGLQQRLSSGHLDQRAAEGRDTLHDLVDGDGVALVERVGRVAPDAAEVAPGQAHEHARTPGVRRFALDRMEDLVDAEHGDILAKAPRKAGRLASAAPRTHIESRTRRAYGTPYAGREYARVTGNLLQPLSLLAPVHGRRLLGLGIGVLLGRLGRSRIVGEKLGTSKPSSRGSKTSRETSRDRWRSSAASSARSRTSRASCRTSPATSIARISTSDRFPGSCSRSWIRSSSPSRNSSTSLAELRRATATKLLHLVERSGATDIPPASPKITVGDGKIGWVASAKVEMLAEDWLNMTRTEGRAIEDNHPSLRLDLIGPLVHHDDGKDRLLGVLCVGNPASRPRDEKAMLQMVTNLASIAYTNSRNMRQLAIWRITTA